MGFMSKRLRDFLTNPNRKIARQNQDTHRVCLESDIHACNECGGWETKSETWREEFPVLHETWCSFYPSLANIELEASLEDDKIWAGSKWDPRSPEYRRVRELTQKSVAERKEKAKAFWVNFGRKS